jgi:hypothetical protein
VARPSARAWQRKYRRPAKPNALKDFLGLLDGVLLKAAP